MNLEKAEQIADLVREIDITKAVIESCNRVINAQEEHQYIYKNYTEKPDFSIRADLRVSSSTGSFYDLYNQLSYNMIIKIMHEIKTNAEIKLQALIQQLEAT